ncbi:MAG: JAB domain-containing protein [Planctomycetota bacterium]|jgi:DNA repair protein RadC
MATKTRRKSPKRVLLAREVAPPATMGFTGAADVYGHMHGRLARITQEEFWVLACDTKNRVQSESMITRGTLDSSLVHPRDVFSFAVLANAASIILVHNHPSGDPEPSPEDVALTRRMADNGDMMGIPVLDHIIIGKGRYVSLAGRGVV